MNWASAACDALTAAAATTASSGTALGRARAATVIVRAPTAAPGASAAATRVPGKVSLHVRKRGCIVVDSPIRRAAAGSSSARLLPWGAEQQLFYLLQQG